MKQVEIRECWMCDHTFGLNNKTDKSCPKCGGETTQLDIVEVHSG